MLLTENTFFHEQYDKSAFDCFFGYSFIDVFSDFVSSIAQKLILKVSSKIDS